MQDHELKISGFELRLPAVAAEGSVSIEGILDGNVQTSLEHAIELLNPGTVVKVSGAELIGAPNAELVLTLRERRGKPVTKVDRLDVPRAMSPAVFQYAIMDDGAATLYFRVAMGDSVAVWAIDAGKYTGTVTSLISGFNADGGAMPGAFAHPNKLNAQWVGTVEGSDVIEQGMDGPSDHEGGKLITVGTYTAEFGIDAGDMREYFLTGDGQVQGILRFVLSDSGWVMQLGSDLVPHVLRTEFSADQLPTLGRSALPQSLEDTIPEEWQYWRRETDEEALEARAALVDSGFLGADNIILVDGEFKRSVTKRYLYVGDSSAALPAKVQDVTVPDIVGDQDCALIPPPEDGIWADWLIECDSPDTQVIIAAVEKRGQYALSLITEATRLDAPCLVGVPNTAAAREALLAIGTPFVAGSDEYVWACSGIVAKSVSWRPVPVVHIEAENALVNEVLAGERVVKAMVPEDAEEQYVLGIVLQPEEVDSQSDIYSHAEVRTAAHKFMEHYQNVGLMHRSVINEKVRILESYLAPVDFEIGSQSVSKGTWLLAVHVIDDDLWQGCKSGDWTGFSIGGSAISWPNDGTAPSTAASS